METDILDVRFAEFGWNVNQTWNNRSGLRKQSDGPSKLLYQIPL